MHTLFGRILGRVLIIFGLGLALWSCDLTLDGDDTDNRDAADERDVLFQASTLDALLGGAYDGIIAFNDLDDHGDFGLGTGDALDGEMIMLDGTAYQVRSDGIAYRIDGAATSPFAVLTYLDPDTTVSWTWTDEEAVDCTQFQRLVDDLLPTLDAPYAVRVDGTFTSLKTRSVDRQEPPYRPLADVIAEEVEFDFTEVDGTMVGFRLPDYMEGFNATGYHFHFLTADRSAGGHVLACEPGEVTVTIDDAGVWEVVLPGEAGVAAHAEARHVPHP